jgi:hypothetical protein
MARLTVLLRRAGLLLLLAVGAPLPVACGGGSLCGKLTEVCKPGGVDCVCAADCPMGTSDCPGDQYCAKDYKVCLPLAWICPAAGAGAGGAGGAASTTGYAIDGRMCPSPDGGPATGSAGGGPATGGAGGGVRPPEPAGGSRG